MCSIQVARQGLCSLAGFTLIVALAMPAAAQTPAAPPADPNPGSMTLTGSVDAVSTYMFRGIRQNSTGIALWPVADLGVALFSGNGGLKSIGANVGTWNSLNTGTPAPMAPLGSSGTNRISTRRWGSGLAAAQVSARRTRPTRARTTPSRPSRR